MLRLISNRHPWRGVSFSDLGEMYTAGFVKNFAMGMITVFIPLYLLQSGFELRDVLIYYTLLYTLNVFSNFLSAHLVARFGPKHVMRGGFFFLFVHAALLTQIDNLPLPLLILAVVHSLSGCLFWLPYHVDFSKVKHKDHSGKEVGWLASMEKVGSVLGPLLGGIIATVFGAKVLFAFAAVILTGAVWILMMSPEPTKTRQKLSFRGLFGRDIRSTLSYATFVTEDAFTRLLWPLFLVIVVLSGSAYMELGAISSVSAVVALFLAVPIGKLLDGRSGRSMLGLGTLLVVLSHLSRIFTDSFISAAFISASKEPATLVFRLPYTRAFYDSADDYLGQRIAYIAKNEILAHALCGAMFGLFALMASNIDDRLLFTIGFGVGAFFAAATLIQDYKLLRK